MAKKKNKFDVDYVSPFGLFRYPYLDEADFEYDEEGKFKTGVIMDPEVIKAEKAKMIAIFRKAFPDDKVKDEKLNLPFGEKDDVEFLKASSKYKPKLYDGKKKKLPAPIGGGSRGRIAGLLHPYVNGANKGVTMYLYDAQVTKLVAKGSGGAMDAVEDEGDEDDVDTSGADEGDEDAGDLDI